MAGVNLYLFFEVVVGSGTTSMPHITTNIPASGPSTVAHTVVNLLSISGGPIATPTIPTVPPFIPVASGPSMIVSTIPILGSQLQLPLVM